MSDQYLRSIKQTASWCGCSDRTIRRLIERGQLRATKVAGCVRIADEDIEQYLAENRVTPKAAR